jgi:hypothetical protein
MLPIGIMPSAWNAAGAGLRSLPRHSPEVPSPRLKSGGSGSEGAPQSRVTVVTTSPSGQSNDGVRVGVRPHTGLAALEDFPLRDPVARLRESFRRVGLEHDTLAGPPTTSIHDPVIANGKLVLVIMGIELGPRVDVAQRALEGAEEIA